ncbi:MAG: hypothetical protein WAS55_13330 [Saprospiraceae bacterium]
MKNDIFSFQFGIRVVELENFITAEIQKIKAKAHQDIDIAISQGILTINLLLHEVSASFEVLKEFVNQRLNPEIEKLIEEISQSNIEELKESTKAKQEANQKKIGTLEVDIKRTKLSYDWKNYRWIKIAIISLCSIDALANYSSLQVLVSNLLVAIILALAVAIGLAFGAHILGSKIRFAMTLKEKAIWFAVGFIGASAVFFYLGMQRVVFSEDSSPFSNSPFLWMLFNDFFFIIALLLASTKLPTREQMLEFNELNDKKNQILQLKHQNVEFDKVFQIEENKVNENRQKLESFKKYKEGLLMSLDKEKELQHATCLKEQELKNGRILLNKNLSNETKLA